MGDEHPTSWMPDSLVEWWLERGEQAEVGWRPPALSWVPSKCRSQSYWWGFVDEQGSVFVVFKAARLKSGAKRT